MHKMEWADVDAASRQRESRPGQLRSIGDAHAACPEARTVAPVKAHRWELTGHCFGGSVAASIVEEMHNKFDIRQAFGVEHALEAGKRLAPPVVVCHTDGDADHQ